MALTELEKFALMVAAVAHDMDHPGEPSSAALERWSAALECWFAGHIPAAAAADAVAAAAAAGAAAAVQPLVQRGCMPASVLFHFE